MKRLLTLGVLAFGSATSLPAAVFDITTFGAKGDGETQNRAAINQAIEAAAAAGGGTVEFPAGTWVTGSLCLRSNVTLRLDQGSDDAIVLKLKERTHWARRGSARILPLPIAW